MIMNRVRQRSISTLKNQFELNLEDGELTAAEDLERSAHSTTT